MREIVRDKLQMIAAMSPELDSASYIFCTTSDQHIRQACAEFAIASFHEKEGYSFVLQVQVAVQLGLPTDLPMRRITLEVNSALDGVGLTAAVASALADQGIPCNMIAAFHHDHAFVPEGMAERAIEILNELQNSKN